MVKTVFKRAGTVFGIVQRVAGRTKFIDTSRICRNPDGGMVTGNAYYIGDNGRLSAVGSRLFGTAIQEHYLTNEASVYVTGGYIGDGTTNRSILLGFTPSAVLLFNCNSTSYGLALPGRNVSSTAAGITSWVNGASSLGITSGGFMITGTTNGQTTNYSYIAFK